MVFRLTPYDQMVYDAGFKYIPQSQYLLNPFQIPREESSGSPVPASPGIPSVYSRSVTGGQTSPDSGIQNLISDYTTTTRDRYFGSQPTPLVDDLYQSKLDKTFLGMPSYQQQQLTGPDLGEYVGTDTDIPLEITTAGKIQQGLGSFREGIGALRDKITGFGPVSAAIGAVDKFGDLPEADQEFIKMNMGYTGPTVFGENTSGLSKDPFGINTRSLFGNYADYVSDKAAEYEDIDDEELAKLTGNRKQQVLFYREKQKELEQVRREKIRQEQERLNAIRRKREAEAQAQAEAAQRAEAQRIQDRNRAERRGGYQSDFTQDRDFMEGRDGAGEGLGPSDRGGSDTMGSFMNGGLVDLVDIYD